MAAKTKKELTAKEKDVLLAKLKIRFEKDRKKFQGPGWEEIEKRLLAKPGILWSVAAMEESGGEPAVLEYDKKKNEFIVYDTAAESPAGRRSYCYDRQALDERKENKPANNAMEVAESMGIELLDEAAYRHLQQWGPFDCKTSSWIKTPADIRKAGGAIFGDYRYGHVFIYHNGAQSYYAARGFRGLVRF